MKLENLVPVKDIKDGDPSQVINLDLEGEWLEASSEADETQEGLLEAMSIIESFSEQVKTLLRRKRVRMPNDMRKTFQNILADASAFLDQWET